MCECFFSERKKKILDFSSTMGLSDMVVGVPWFYLIGSDININFLFYIVCDNEQIH